MNHSTLIWLNHILKPDHIIDSLLDAFTLDGSIYGIPKDFNTLAVFTTRTSSITQGFLS